MVIKEKSTKFEMGMPSLKNAKNLKKAFISIFLLILSIKCWSIDPQFSQFYSNPLYLAPSFAGAVDGSRVALNYRSQWLDNSADFKAYRSYNFSFDHYFSNFNSGVGLLAFRDVAGQGNLGIFRLGFMYSYNIQIFNTWHIRPGMSIYYMNTSVDFNKLVFIDQVKSNYKTNVTFAQIPYNNLPLHKFDAGASMLIYSRNLWFGGTIDHLMKPEGSFYDPKNQFFSTAYSYRGYAGVTLVKNSRLLNPIDETLTLAMMYRQQEMEEQVDIGLYWYKSPLVLGVWYRGIPIEDNLRGDAFIFLLGYKTQYFNVGYSYDFTISNLIGQTNGSHEISLVYKFNFPEKKKKRGSVPCPEF